MFTQLTKENFYNIDSNKPTDYKPNVGSSENWGVSPTPSSHENEPLISRFVNLLTNAQEKSSNFDNSVPTNALNIFSRISQIEKPFINERESKTLSSVANMILSSLITVSNPNYQVSLVSCLLESFRVMKKSGQDSIQTKELLDVAAQTTAEKIDIIEILPRESNGEINTLVGDFKKATEVKECKRLAGKIFDSCKENDEKVLSQLRSIYNTVREDHKKACILQLLGELFDKNSLSLFLSVIRGFSDNSDLKTPSLTQIAALTYIRLIKIPNDKALKDVIIKQIVEFVERYARIDFDEKKFLIGGSLLTVRVLGDLANSYQFLVKYLDDQDINIIKLTLDAIRGVWLTTVKNSEQSNIEKYKLPLFNKLRTLIHQHQTNRQLVEKVLLTVELIDPKLLTDVLPEQLAVALNNNFTGLTTTIISIFEKLPRKLRRETLTAFLQKSSVSTESMKNLLVFVLVEY